ncbi:peptidase [Cohnella xylanilytica]|uniref:Slipin family protein n=1 Tax=Cohnella xylanilytica TaxID=557555 RepID=A0A841U8Q5_9BACL|nr:slipin family protein [Cohnella xylanilytica]MBB6694633.1 slipin family protein [Cohnella xylanilytica]GIO14272.1 peptidase [Cohnella xylanilytica]
MTKFIIREDERGLLFREGRYVKPLAPGTYRFWSFANHEIATLKTNQPFRVPERDIEPFLQDDRLRAELTVVDVPDYEYALHFEDGKFARLLTAGKHAFWNVWKRHEFVRVDARDPEIPPEVDVSVLTRIGSAYVQSYEVASHEAGLLFIGNEFERTLKPGVYRFWRGPVPALVRTVDMRQQQLDMTGQEMMTEDKVTLRLNFVCQYRIVDPLKSLEIRSFEDQVYVLLQLILREYVGTMKLDELLRAKQEVGSYALGKLKEKAGDYGVEFLSAGVKDIILPGDVKEILNTVLIAEKKAQANLITRREETASTRSLLNTAKLLDENETLYRLKELEFMEKICDKIGSVSLSNGGNVLEQLNSLFSVRGTRG